MYIILYAGSTYGQNGHVPRAPRLEGAPHLEDVPLEKLRRRKKNEKTKTKGYKGKKKKREKRERENEGKKKRK